MFRIGGFSFIIGVLLIGRFGYKGWGLGGGWLIVIVGGGGVIGFGLESYIDFGLYSYNTGLTS